MNKQSKSKMQYGSTTVKASGCGPIAAHNAMILAGRTSSLADTVHYFDSRELIFGNSGTNLFTVKEFLMDQGYHPKMEIAPTDFDSLVKNSPNHIGILLYQHPDGGHFIAVQWDGEMFHMYNEGQENGVPSVDEYIRENNYTSKMGLGFSLNAEGSI